MAVTLNNLEAIKLLVKNNFGISLLPNLFAQADINQGELISIPLVDSPFSPHTTYLAFRPEQWLEGEFLQNLIQELMAILGADNS